MHRCSNSYLHCISILHFAFPIGYVVTGCVQIRIEPHSNFRSGQHMGVFNCQFGTIKLILKCKKRIFCDIKMSKFSLPPPRNPSTGGIYLPTHLHRRRSGASRLRPPPGGRFATDCWDPLAPHTLPSVLSCPPRPESWRRP